MSDAIKISNLKKSYGTHVVLNGLDFYVQQGEIFSLFGVNGAGKTTSLECIEGLRKYDSGSKKTILSIINRSEATASFGACPNAKSRYSFSGRTNCWA